MLLTGMRRNQVEDKARRKLDMPPIALTDELLDRIERHAGNQRVEQLLARLTPEQADAVRARVLAEESYPEIATSLRCSRPRSASA